MPASRRPALIALALCAACGADRPVTPVDPVASVTFRGGRGERGDTVAVVLHAERDSTSGAALSLTVQPADGATVLPGGLLVLRRAGNLAVTASAAGQTSATGVLAVVVPPSVLFDMSVDGNRDIYRVALDGGDLVRLTTASLDDVHPTSAAGTVLFTSWRDGVAALYAAGGSAADRRLTTSAEGETAPALSADGRRVAWVREQGGVARVWVAAADGSGAARLTAGPTTGGQPEASPTWTPDGRITFTSTATGQADLATAADAAAATPVPIAAANTSFAEVEPAWSADGRRLAFVSTRDGDASIYVLDGASGAVVRLTPAGESAGQPAWLADGRVVYVVQRGTTSVLRWRDPAAPGTAREIAVPGAAPEHPAASR